MLVVPRDENVGEEGDEEIIPALADALFNAEENCIGNTCTLPATQHLQLRVNKNLKGGFSKPSGDYIVVPNFCFLS